MRGLTWIIFWVSLVLVVGSFGGALHGLGDSLAVFRHWWAVSLTLSSAFLLAARARIAVFGFAAVALGAAPMVTGYLGSSRGDAGAFSLYQKNLLFKGTDPVGIVSDILAVAPDFVTLQEVSHGNLQVFDVLAETYTSSLFCPFAGVGGVAVMSKWPLLQSTCAGNQGIAAIQVQTPVGAIWVTSIHLHWPFPHGQPSQVARLLPELERMEGPVILAGDFNMVPWSYTLRAMARATGSQRAGPVVRTFAHDASPLRLPIDHILVPGGRGNLEVRPNLGSDHVGLLLRFDL